MLNGTSLSLSLSSLTTQLGFADPKRTCLSEAVQRRVSHAHPSAPPRGEFKYELPLRASVLSLDENDSNGRLNHLGPHSRALIWNGVSDRPPLLLQADTTATHDEMTITQLPIGFPASNKAEKGLGPSEGTAPDTPPSKRARIGDGGREIGCVCYACEATDLPGKFDSKKADELGIPKVRVVAFCCCSAT